MSDCVTKSYYKTYGGASKFKGNAGAHKVLNTGFGYQTKEFNLKGKGWDFNFDFDADNKDSETSIKNAWSLATTRSFDDKYTLNMKYYNCGKFTSWFEMGALNVMGYQLHQYYTSDTTSTTAIGTIGWVCEASENMGANLEVKQDFNKNETTTFVGGWLKMGDFYVNDQVKIANNMNPTELNARVKYSFCGGDVNFNVKCGLENFAKKSLCMTLGALYSVDKCLKVAGDVKVDDETQTFQLGVEQHTGDGTLKAKLNSKLELSLHHCHNLSKSIEAAMYVRLPLTDLGNLKKVFDSSKVLGLALPFGTKITISDCC